MENKNQQVKLMNLPNILSLVRMVLVPFCIAAVLYMPTWCDGVENNTLYYWLICAIPALIFAITSFTDMLDGKIARKYGLITDFGKFIDPLADKFMVFGILIAVLASDVYWEIRPIFIWVTAIVMLRELGVTSLRLVVASRGVVVPASWWGKIKTVTQIVSLVVILLEPAIIYAIFGGFSGLPTDGFNVIRDGHLLAGLAMGGITVTTVGSGLDYLRHLWPYVAGKK